MNNILVTGGAGFIGSHFIKHLLRDKRQIRIVNLDLLTYAGTLENLTEVMKDSRHHFVQGDVGDQSLVEELFQKFQIDTVVHFAAESHVDRSIHSPRDFLTTNVLGTQTLLEAARHNWKTGSEDPRDRSFMEGVRYLQVSTDEVYGSLKQGDAPFTEASPLAPNSPYSASKAGADLLVHAYYETYGLPVNITRCSNNYGPNQHPEKLIPLMLDHCIRGESLPIYGDGCQIRDWLYVGDHCGALEAVLQKGRSGEIYNIGGDTLRKNLEVVTLLMEKSWRKGSSLCFVPDRPGHDRFYAVDHTKLTEELGWSPSTPFEQGLEETVKWYLTHESWLEARQNTI